jgi:predicted porin
MKPREALKLSIAVCFGSTAPRSMAQSSLTIHGRADASIGREIDSNGQFREGQREGSLLGFKGQEDLGGGYSVFFDLQFSLETTWLASYTDFKGWHRYGYFQ